MKRGILSRIQALQAAIDPLYRTVMLAMMAAELFLLVVLVVEEMRR